MWAWLMEMLYGPPPKYVNSKGTPIPYRIKHGGAVDISPASRMMKESWGTFHSEQEAVINMFLTYSDDDLGRLFGLKRTGDYLQPLVPMTDEELEQYNLAKGGWDLCFA